MPRCRAPSEPDAVADAVAPVPLARPWSGPLARRRLATVDGRLVDPIGDGLGRDIELARQFCRRSSRAHELDHLLMEFRRVRRSDFGHLRLLEHKA